MDNKKKLLFGLIEMNINLFNFLYVLLGLVVLVATGILLLTSLMHINETFFCNECTGRLIILWYGTCFFLAYKVFA